ncbi:hypothetical protein ACQKEX_14810 [Bacillus pumilus]|uniref:hypothetical protein n=1 Tax=Bacillus TaxID=1386 RepID=UPI001C2263D5|nr:hypothetical protein [Bacillus pumilus]MBU8576397.1 hypothetical protein [Bacillus pumilus]
MIYSDKVYLLGNGQKIYVFSIATHRGLTHGIGVTLCDGDVLSFTAYEEEVTYLGDFKSSEIYTLGYMKKIRENMSKSLGIVGRSRAGKGTLLKHLLKDRYTGGHAEVDKDFPNRNKIRTSSGEILSEVVHIDLADPIRSCNEVVFGKTVKKERGNLIFIGQALREKDEFVWAKVWLRRAIEAFSSSTVFAVTDIRQPSDLAFFNSLGFTTVKVVADETKRTEVIEMVDGADTLHLMEDETETFVDNMSTDFEVFNHYSDFKYLDGQAPEALLNFFSVKE